MNKFFVLLFAISAVSYINSQECALYGYLHYFISLLSKAPDTNIECPEFLLSKEEKIKEIYYMAARKLKQGAKWDDVMAEAGLQISGIPEFREKCNNMPLSGISQLLLFDNEEAKREINKVIRSNRYVKSELISNGFGYMTSLRRDELFQQVIESSEYFGKYLAIFLQLKDDDPKKILDSFKSCL